MAGPDVIVWDLAAGTMMVKSQIKNVKWCYRQEWS